MEQAFTTLLNFEAPLDVPLLDQVVEAFYVPGNTKEQTALISEFLTTFQSHPAAWQRVDTILEHSTSEKTKFFALQILESCIKHRWNALPAEQREGIKAYVVGVIIKFSSGEGDSRGHKMYLGKLNLSLLEVLKKEWPQNWEGFIPQLVESGQTNEVLCENNMQILRLLSEEIFDFSADQMTQAKCQHLKSSLTHQFQLIYQFCEFVLMNATRVTLLKETLRCLQRYLTWIPLVFIFETKLIETLVTKFFMDPNYRNLALACLAEIAATKGSDSPQYAQQLGLMFSMTMQGLATFLKPNNVPPISQVYDDSDDETQVFIKGLGLFVVAFLKNNIAIAEQDPTLAVNALTYLINISEVDDDEVFNITLDYWHLFSDELYHREIEFQRQPPLLLMGGGAGMPNQCSPRLTMYRDSGVMSNLRRVMIERMPKPEEVLVVVDDATGEVTREHLTDVEAVALHKSMRESLVFLTHLDFSDTQQLMLSKLQTVTADSTNWDKQQLSTLCWAIGSISGAMKEEEEKHFLVTVIKDLLGLCELTKGKDNKAVIASNIMYVVGQYPRFLKAHWKFLKTVVKKLFEFMHETHPGVQDMACETFLKIAQRCRFKFVRTQAMEQQPFVRELLGELGFIIRDLESHHIYMFYEAVGFMISAEVNAAVRDELLAKLFEIPNAKWQTIIAQAGQDQSILQHREASMDLSKILATNVRVAGSLGHAYMSQFGVVLKDALQVYKLYSDFISSTVAAQGQLITKSAQIRSMRAVKRETLKLVETVIEKTEDVNRITQDIVPLLLDPVLGDYMRNHKDTKDAEVLSLFAAIVDKAQGAIIEGVPRILEATFCTLDMITENMSDYPDHRINFFRLLRAINQHCFTAFFVMGDKFKTVIDSIVWAFKHTERNIAETGLQILHKLLDNIEGAGDVAAPFYQQFFLPLVQDIFVVLTDTMHKTGFKLQAAILMHCCHKVESGAIAAPIAPNMQMTNQQFLRGHMLQLLTTAFPHVSQAQVQAFVAGLFDLSKSLPDFKVHLRDFLINLKEFSSDNEALFSEETEMQRQQAEAARAQAAAAVPGLLPLAQRPDGAIDMSGDGA